MGAEPQTFKGNKIVMGVMAVLGLGAAWTVFAAYTGPADNGFRLFSVILLAIPAFLFFWVRSVEISLTDYGLTYRSMFGEKEIRWDSLERFEYAAVRRSVNFIPIGTYYHFKLVDADGKKLRFGNRVEHCAKLGSALIEQTYPALFRKVVDRFNTDQEVDFGAIRVSRTGGIKLKKFWGGYKEIPWDQISSYNIQKGNFYIWPIGVKRTQGPGIRQVPNAFVLLGLMNAVLKPNA